MAVFPSQVMASDGSGHIGAVPAEFVTGALCYTEFALSLESQLGENKPEACIPDT